MSEEERFWFRMAIICLIIIVFAMFFSGCATRQQRGEEQLWKDLQAEQKLGNL